MQLVTTLVSLSCCNSIHTGRDHGPWAWLSKLMPVFMGHDGGWCMKLKRYTYPLM